MGKRKAWYIGQAGADAIVVFKNNNPEKRFVRVRLEFVHLDCELLNETEPVTIPTVHHINMALKKVRVK
jgi:hypothetical protein